MFGSNQNDKYRIYMVLFLSIGISTVLSGLPVDAFMDRDNYLVYSSSSVLILKRYLDGGIFSTIFNEPVWLLINILSSTVFSPENTVRLIIAFSSAVTWYLVLKNNPKHFWIVLVFLISPQVIMKNIIHLRQGLAIAIFLIGWYSENDKKRVLFYFLAPLIHASFFFILLLLCIKWLTEKLKLAPDLKIIVFLLVGVFVGLSLGFIASSLGSRQGSEYSFSMTNVSGLGFLFWSCVFCLYVSQGEQFIRSNVFEFGLLIFYLATYFLIEVTGRIFESGILVVLLSSLMLVGWRNKLFVLMYVTYVLFQYLMRMGRPWLGMGVGM